MDGVDRHPSGTTVDSAHYAHSLRSAAVVPPNSIVATIIDGPDTISDDRESGQARSTAEPA